MEWNGGGEMEERMSIRDSSKSLKKYGSTARHMTRNENLIKHLVSANDTLQGIALKYGVTVRKLLITYAHSRSYLSSHLSHLFPDINTLVSIIRRFNTLLCYFL